jgi:hypothetical protein
LTRDILDPLTATCATDRLADTRDPLPCCCWRSPQAGGGAAKWRGLRIEQLSDEPAVSLNPTDPKSPTLPCVSIHLGRTKTGDADDEGRVFLVGRPVGGLREWLERSDIQKGRSSVRSTAGRQSWSAVSPRSRST